MATLTTSNSGNTPGYNIQWYENGKRQTIYLGGKRYSKRTAERFKDIVETLIHYQYNGITVPDKQTALWIQSAPKHLQQKLAQVGLITVAERHSCGQLWEAFLKHKRDVKQKTINGYTDSRVRFFKTFEPNELVDKITPMRLIEWKTNLLTEYSAATVAGTLKVVKTLLNWAVKNDWIAKNPSNGIPRGSFINRENDRIIRMEEYLALLNACPTQEWRSLLALVRIGGLRSPSETMRLKWADINWEQNRFSVTSPKTEHHAGHECRLVPLFPELREELEIHQTKVYAQKPEYVLQHLRKRKSQYQTFQLIAKKAGLGNILRPFDNMRMSRSNEVLNRWGAGKESLWIGHSQKVMKDHYLLLSDEDFNEAAKT